MATRTEINGIKTDFDKSDGLECRNNACRKRPDTCRRGQPSCRALRTSSRKQEIFVLSRKDSGRPSRTNASHFSRQLMCRLHYPSLQLLCGFSVAVSSPCNERHLVCLTSPSYALPGLCYQARGRKVLGMTANGHQTEMPPDRPETSAKSTNTRYL